MRTSNTASELEPFLTNPYRYRPSALGLSRTGGLRATPLFLELDVGCSLAGLSFVLSPLQPIPMIGFLRRGVFLESGHWSTPQPVDVIYQMPNTFSGRRDHFRPWSSSCWMYVCHLMICVIGLTMTSIGCRRDMGMQGNCRVFNAVGDHRPLFEASKL